MLEYPHLGAVSTSNTFNMLDTAIQAIQQHSRMGRTHVSIHSSKYMKKWSELHTSEAFPRTTYFRGGTRQ